MAAGANPVLITRGIEKTAKALVEELKSISKEVIFNGLIIDALFVPLEMKGKET